MNPNSHAPDRCERPAHPVPPAGRQVSNHTGAAALLGCLPQADWFLADRGHDADWLREALKDKRIKSLHPRPQIPQDDGEIQQAALQKAQPHRGHVRSTEGLATGWLALRQVPRNSPFCNRIGRDRHLPVMIKNEA